MKGLLASGGEAAVEGDLEGVEGGFPAHHPPLLALAGGVEAHDRQVDALERGLLVGEVSAGSDRPADPRVDRLEALLSSGSCQAAAGRSVTAGGVFRSASFHMCRMMTLASCRLWHRRASRLLLFSSIFRATYSFAGG